jgi:hypothetical protein
MSTNYHEYDLSSILSNRTYYTTNTGGDVYYIQLPTINTYDNEFVVEFKNYEWKKEINDDEWKEINDVFDSIIKEL